MAGAESCHATVNIMYLLNEQLFKQLQKCYSPLYFLLVAIPPRIWRSFLFFWSTTFTCFQSTGSLLLRRSVTSLCTVDLLILNCLAAALTVASFSIIYSPSIIARSSTVFLIRSTPSALLFKYMPYKCRLYCRIVTLCNKDRRNFVCAGSMCCRHCALSPLILHYG